MNYNLEQILKLVKKRESVKADGHASLIQKLIDKLSAEASDEYIVVEVADRNHHICKKQLGSNYKYTSLANGRSRSMMDNLCRTLNKEHQGR